MDAGAQQDELRRDLVEAYAAIAPSVLPHLHVEATDEKAREALGRLCIAVFNAGVRAGAQRAISELAEQGVDVTLNLDPNLLPRT